MLKKIKKWLNESDTFEIVAIIFILFGIIVIGFAVYWGAWLNEVILVDSVNPITDYSEFIGGIVGSFWSLAGVLLFYASLTSQKKDLEAQKDLLVKQIDEIVAQTKESRIQNEMLKEQKNEETFFQLLKFHNEILQNIAIETSEIDFATGNSIMKTINGRKSFVEYYDIYKRFFQETSETMNTTSNEDLNKLFDKSYRKFFIEYQSDLGHYFRNLFNVLVFVNSLKESVQPFYLSLLKSQLSNFELALLLFHCLKTDNAEFKSFVEKNGVLSTVPQDEVTSMAHVLYDEDAFGDEGFGDGGDENTTDFKTNEFDFKKEIEKSSSFLDKIDGFTDELNSENANVSGLGSMDDIMSKLDNISLDSNENDDSLIDFTDDKIISKNLDTTEFQEEPNDLSDTTNLNADNKEDEYEDEDEIKIDISHLSELANDDEGGSDYESNFLNSLQDNFDSGDVIAELTEKPEKNEFEAINPNLFADGDDSEIENMNYADLKDKLDSGFDTEVDENIFIKEDIVEKNKNANTEIAFDKSNESNEENEDEFTFNLLKEKLDSNFKTNDNFLLNKETSIIDESENKSTKETAPKDTSDDLDDFSLESLYEDEFTQEDKAEENVEEFIEDTSENKSIITIENETDDNSGEIIDFENSNFLDDISNQNEQEITDNKANSLLDGLLNDYSNDSIEGNEQLQTSDSKELDEDNKTVQYDQTKKKKVIIKRKINNNDDIDGDKPKGKGFLSKLK